MDMDSFYFNAYHPSTYHFDSPCNADSSTYAFTSTTITITIILVLIDIYYLEAPRERRPSVRGCIVDK